MPGVERALRVLRGGRYGFGEARQQGRGAHECGDGGGSEHGGRRGGPRGGLPARPAAAAERAALAHTHLFSGDLWGRLGGLLARVPSHVSTLHNVRTNETPLARRIQQALAAATDRVIACTAEVARSYVEAGLVPARKVVVIPNGVDLRRFERARAAPGTELGAGDPAAKAALGLAPDRPALGVLARLFPQKGHAVLLRAAAEIVRARLGAQLAIAGEGPLREELEAEARRLGIGDAVRFLGSRSDAPRVLAALDIFALPSLWEGLPVALLEALAARRPVVATAVGGVPAVVREGETGRLVRPGEPEGLARAAIDHLARPAEARRLAAAGYALVEREYSLGVTVRRYEAVWAALARRGARRAA